MDAGPRVGLFARIGDPNRPRLLGGGDGNGLFARLFPGDGSGLQLIGAGLQAAAGIVGAGVGSGGGYIGGAGGGGFSGGASRPGNYNFYTGNTGR